MDGISVEQIRTGVCPICGELLSIAEVSAEEDYEHVVLEECVHYSALPKNVVGMSDTHRVFGFVGCIRLVCYSCEQEYKILLTPDGEWG